MKNFVKALLIAIIGNAVNKLLSGGERRNYRQENQPVKNPRYNAALLCNTGNFDYGYNVVGDFVPKSAGDSNIEYGRNVVGDFVPKSINGQHIEYGYNVVGDYVPQYIGGTPDVLREYKQEKYNSGYSVSSVKTYLALVKSIITHACPYKEQMAKQLEILSAIDMNILDKPQIEKLLSLAKREFKWGYPIIRLGLLSGANVPEILALQWENVFFSEKRIHISKFLHSGK